MTEREALKLALESLKELVADPECDFGPSYELQEDRQKKAISAIREALAQPEQEPLTPREVELLDGMIEVQLHHAAQCDRIANRTMAEKQKSWDMERVELLRKLKDAHDIKEKNT